MAQGCGLPGFSQADDVPNEGCGFWRGLCGFAQFYKPHRQIVGNVHGHVASRWCKARGEQGYSERKRHLMMCMWFEWIIVVLLDHVNPIAKS